MSGFARFRVTHGSTYGSRPRGLATGNRPTNQSLVGENQPQRMSSPISLVAADNMNATTVHTSEDSTNKCRQNCDQPQGKMEMQMACVQDKVVIEEAVKLSTEFDRVMRRVERRVQEAEQVICSQSQNKSVDSKERSLEWLGLIVRQVCQIQQISQTQQFCLNKHDLGSDEETIKTMAWEEQSQNWSDLLVSKSADGYRNSKGILCSSKQDATAIAEKETAEACLAVARKDLQEARLQMKIELDRTREASVAAKARLEEQEVELRRCSLIEKQFSTLQTKHDATLEELASVQGAVRELNEQYLALRSEHNNTLDDIARMRDQVGELESKQDKIRLCEHSAAREITVEEKLKKTLDAPTKKHVKRGWSWCLPKNNVCLMTGGCIS